MEMTSGDARKLAAAIDKLSMEAANLRRDTRALAKRFFPKTNFESEYRPAPAVTLPVRNAADMLDRMKLHRQGLVDAQGDIGRIRSLLVEIKEDTRSRTDWEPLLNEASSGRRRDDD